ncbi:MAG: helix-turn-helix domain-containing protein [Alphaproteobacteria bacterium]|nr:helix-turn-helix domain-containing protein [Alphaproteobacteria bacterium]
MDDDHDDDIDQASEARKGSPFLTTAQAAHYLGLTTQTLEKMRRKGRGPRYRKHGRYVRYHIAELDAWSRSSSRNAVHETKKSKSGGTSGEENGDG